MMACLFFLILLAFIFAWRGHRQLVLFTYSLLLIFSVTLFYQDMTSQLSIQL